MEKDVSGLNELNKKKFSSPEEYHDFLMFHIQSHLVEVSDLKANKDPHLVKELADLTLLSYMLAINEGADKNIFKERIKKIESKIKGKE